MIERVFLHANTVQYESIKHLTFFLLFVARIEA